MATIQERVSRLEAVQKYIASKADFAELKAEMRAMELRITLRLGGLMIGIAGVMTAIIVFEQHFLP